MIGGDEWLRESQRALNASTAAAWRRYAPHRQRVTELAVGAAPAHGGRLCALGAGNCNDLELRHLVERFDEVTLVDLDAEALRVGVERQGLSGDPRLVLRGDVELGGAVRQLAAWRAGAAVQAHELDELGRRPAGLVEALGRHDVVLSAGLLSQLVHVVGEALPAGHAARLPAALARRRSHCELLLGLLVPGGAVVLVTDVVSSETLPALLEAPDDLVGLLAETVRVGNVFAGGNPFTLGLELQGRPDVVAMTPAGPWTWDVGESRRHLVVALTLRSSTSSSTW